MSPRDFKLSNSIDKVTKRLSQLLRTQRQPQGHECPPNPSPLAMVPIDVIEDILLYLPGQDIIRMKQV